MSQARIDWNSASKDYGTVSFSDDNDLVVTFYQKSVQDINASQQEGLPVFKEAIYVKIFRAGEMMNIIDRPVSEQDKQRFRSRWQNFQLDRTQVPEGTPIELLFPNHPAVADTLKARGVYTVQQLSNLTAHAMDTVGMGAQEYVTRAQNYLKAASNGKNVVAMQEELIKKEQQIRLQQVQIDELSAKVNILIQDRSSPITQDKQSGTVNAPFVKGYDAQSERINATHITSDQVVRKSK